MNPAPTDMPTLENLRLRSEMLRALRDCLHALGLVEVETPVRIPTPALEQHIDALPSGRGWLRTSPELHMKRLLGSGAGAIYQIGPCFRARERGARHHPEFTMLEWYRAPAGYRDILSDCRELLDAVFTRLALETSWTYGLHRVRLDADWEEISVREAYRRWAGWDPVRNWDAERFDRDMGLVVEPALPTDRPVVLIDYPAPAAALARLKPGSEEVAERWELYLAGMELCNAFSELTDAAEQRRRFEDCARMRRRAGQEVYALDEPFLAALAEGMPPCGGASLGIDRLAMFCAAAERIDQVRPFCEPPGAAL